MAQRNPSFFRALMHFQVNLNELSCPNGNTHKTLQNRNVIAETQRDGAFVTRVLSSDNVYYLEFHNHVTHT